MRRSLVVLFALGALVVGGTNASARPTTTAPGYNYTIKVTITGKGVLLSSSDAKRGWLLHFAVTNKDSKPHIFSVGGMATKKLAPGATGKIGAYAQDRGQFKYYLDKALKGYFQVV